MYNVYMLKGLKTVAKSSDALQGRSQEIFQGGVPYIQYQERHFNLKYLERYFELNLTLSQITLPLALNYSNIQITFCINLNSFFNIKVFHWLQSIQVKLRLMDTKDLTKEKHLGIIKHCLRYQIKTAFVTKFSNSGQIFSENLPNQRKSLSVNVGKTSFNQRQLCMYFNKKINKIKFCSILQHSQTSQNASTFWHQKFGTIASGSYEFDVYETGKYVNILTLSQVNS
eukprot:TRINITY_DN9830_c0_g1_i4.p1 TRINITY_DN9830_c0_g1~~TRINITY_DN9830_c0_g1_i4.p1  ORF type:complete len:227 (-),score=-12.21 TRINITY_DN9830_c0_g1_i4:62-742(-)